MFRGIGGVLCIRDTEGTAPAEGAGTDCHFLSALLVTTVERTNGVSADHGQEK
jgi:hypothetical protein